MRLPRKGLEPGEWQEEVNQYGGVQRYRMIGGVIKEYETMVKIDGMEIPESQVEDYHLRKKEAEQARKEAEKNRPAPPPRKNCPFRESMQTDCKREQCALFDGNGCTLAQIAARATTDTAGKSCPFSPHTCRADCGLYKNGCVMTAIKERT